MQEERQDFVKVFAEFTCLLPDLSLILCRISLTNTLSPDL